MNGSGTRQLHPPRSIAIDGPAGAGKSTIGARLAERLGYRYFDTGLLYRAVSLAALQRNYRLDDEAALANLAQELDLTFLPSTVADGRQLTVLLNGVDVTHELRHQEVNAVVSRVAALPRVRQALLERQRSIGCAGNIVMVGRDIGTTVMPDADLKIYLDASSEERAQRRHAEQLARCEASDLESVRAIVRERDRIDSSRATSPLRAAADAVRVDTDGLTIDQVLAQLLALCGLP